MLNFQLQNACNTLKNKRKTKSCELATALSTLCVRFFVKKPLLVLESESESDGTHFFTPSSTRHNAEHRCCGLAHTHMHFSFLYIPYNSALSQVPGVGGLTDYWIQKTRNISKLPWLSPQDHLHLLHISFQNFVVPFESTQIKQCVSFQSLTCRKRHLFRQWLTETAFEPSQMWCNRRHHCACSFSQA